MKLLLFSLSIFATVFLLSSALPHDKEKGRHKSLTDSTDINDNEKSLQRRKPPGKMPGPKLTPEERDSDALAENPRETESKMKNLSRDGKEKREKKNTSLKKYKSEKDDHVAPLEEHTKNEKSNKHRRANLLGGDRYNADRKEETQEEKSSPL